MPIRRLPVLAGQIGSTIVIDYMCDITPLMERMVS